MFCNIKASAVEPPGIRAETEMLKMTPHLTNGTQI